MKVFKFDKTVDYKLVEDIKKIKINKKEAFDKIIMNNPLSSNNICIVNYLKLCTDNKVNAAEIIISSSFNESIDEIKVGCMNILCGNMDMIFKENMLLDEIHIDKNRTIDVLNENFIIILPGGSFIIKLDKFINNVELQIVSVEEKI